MNIGLMILIGSMLMAFQIPVLLGDEEDGLESGRMPEGRAFK